MGNCGGGGETKAPQKQTASKPDKPTESTRRPSADASPSKSRKDAGGTASGLTSSGSRGDRKQKQSESKERKLGSSQEREVENFEAKRHEKLRGTDDERRELLTRDKQAETAFKQKLAGDYVAFAKTEEDVELEKIAVILQRKWRFLKMKRILRSVVFRHVWKQLEASDERIIADIEDNDGLESKARLGKGGRSSSHNISGSIRNKDTASDWLKYPNSWNDMDMEKKQRFVSKFVSALKRQEVIPENYVWSVLEDAKAELRERPNVQRVRLDDVHGEDVKAPHANRVIVVGDLHGNLADLLYILEKGQYRLPEPSNKYVFNGDFVDRGDNSVEVIVLLLTLVMAFPGSVFLNRGNHEGRGCSQTYGFYTELVSKYNNRDLFDAFVDLFNVLPLCTVVEDEVLIVHGGPPRPDSKGEQITLDKINHIKRFSDIPCVRRENLSEFSRDEIILADLLWSDPHPGTGSEKEPLWTFNSLRSNGILFRPGHSNAFCKKNKLSMIIRSHEAVDSGFVKNAKHNGKVVTVFSASNYGGLEGNDAAVIEITRRAGKITSPGSSVCSRVDINTFTWCMHTDTPAPATAGASTNKDVVKRLQSTALYTQDEVVRLLTELIHKQRHELATKFVDKDPQGTGFVSPTAWAEVMGSLLAVPWYALRTYLVEPDSQGRIAWMSRFLYRFHCRLEDRLLERWAPYILQWVLKRAEYKFSNERDMADSLYERGVPDGGDMTYKSFFNILKAELDTTISKDVIFMLFVYLDKFKSGRPPTGKITRENWKRACADASKRGLFVHERTEIRKDPENPTTTVSSDFHLWDWWLVQRFREMFRGMPDTVSAYRLFDQDRDTHINIEDLRKGIANLNLAISHTPSFKKQAKLWPEHGDRAGEIADLFGTPSQTGALQASIDGKKNPVFITTWPMQDSQIKAFQGLMDHDLDGKVSFRDFVLSFYIRDREHDDKIRRTTGKEPTIWHELNDDIWGTWGREGGIGQQRTRSIRQSKGK